MSRAFGGLKAVEGVTLSVPEGTIYGIIGRTAPARPRCSTC
jgi:ABC-type branched-subunit amino acid transport system ATPase component